MQHKLHGDGNDLGINVGREKNATSDRKARRTRTRVYRRMPECGKRRGRMLWKMGGRKERKGCEGRNKWRVMKEINREKEKEKEKEKAKEGAMMEN
jgi:hypothetical protein